MTKKVFMVGGLGNGDEGKGSVVDFLTHKHKAHTIVRFNGGPQALHHVVRPDGLMHGFRQIGSGTLACPEMRTYLSRFMVVNPFFLDEEINELSVKKGLKYCRGRIIIDRNCVIVTPFHRLINQMLEISRFKERFGSCGHGIGEAIKDWISFGEDTLLAGDLLDKQKTLRKLKHLLVAKIDLAEQLLDEVGEYIFEPTLKLRDKLRQLYSYSTFLDRLSQQYYDLVGFGFLKLGDSKILKKLLNKSETVIFEGAQGVLLDPRHGFAPHVTKTKTNFDNADEVLCDVNYDGEVTKIGVMRAYGTRHGTGPFVAEDPGLTALIPDIHNKENEWQGNFRIGWLDLVSGRYALDAMGKIDYVALTNLDRIINLPCIRVCTHYLAYKDKKISKIKKDSNVLPDKQATLTKMLKGCRPVYKKLTGLTQESYINFIEKELGIRISIVSNGPTFKDKVQILSPR